MGFFTQWLEKIVPPSSGKFFQQLRELSVQVHEGAGMLRAAAAGKTLGTPGFTAEIHSHENRADALTEKFLLSVRHTMIHPVDPDDLRDIANSLDTVMDTMDHYSWRMEAYRLTPTGPMMDMIDMIDAMTGELVTIFDLLIAKRLAEVDETYRRLSDLEKRADGIFHNAVRALHARGEKTYTVDDEVLAILEECADRCKEVGQFVVVMLERNR